MPLVDPLPADPVPELEALARCFNGRPGLPPDRWRCLGGQRCGSGKHGVTLDGAA